MKLKHSCLVFVTVTEISALGLFISDHTDAVNVQIQFDEKAVELFDCNGHLVARRGFSELY